MPIVGFNFEKIGVRKDNNISGKLEIKNNVSITSIEQEKLSLSSSDDVLKFGFDFKTNYEPKIGGIQISGNVVFMDEPKKVDEIMKSWKKDKKIPKEISVPIINTILSRCTVKALNLSQDVGLPPHIKLPLVKSKS